MAQQASKPKKLTSRVLRVSGENYEKLTRLKKLFAKKNKKDKATYDEFLGQLLSVSEALLSGSERYLVGDRVYTDVADARGQAILDSHRTGKAVEMPCILIRLGKDDAFKAKL